MIEIISRSRTMLKMAQKEANLMTGLCHNNVVQFVEYFKEFSNAFFVMGKVYLYLILFKIVF